MLDSQDIPRDLLGAHKDDIIIDNFIYYLKKYSLITPQSPSYSGPAFSIHRSIQAATLAYLVDKLKLEKNSHLIQSISETLKETVTSAQVF